MPFVYKYIDITNEANYKIVYIGKVTTETNPAIKGLINRHKQHQHDDWYKSIGEDNLILEYAYLDSCADADIYETYLIGLVEKCKLSNCGEKSLYKEEDFHLFNKAKRWGATELRIEKLSNWKVYYDSSMICLDNEINEQKEKIVDLMIDADESEIMGMINELKTKMKAYSRSKNKIERYLKNVKLGFLLKYSYFKCVSHSSEDRIHEESRITEEESVSEIAKATSLLYEWDEKNIEEDQ